MLIDRVARALAAALLLATLAAGARAEDGGAMAPACAATARRSAQDARIARLVAAAREQHRVFGGQVINRSGGLVAIGFHEAEHDHRLADGVPTWQRVARFWQALDPAWPEYFRLADGSRIYRQAMTEQVQRLRGPDGAPLAQRQREALATAVMRTTLVDQPWSAAFISAMVREAGFERPEFAFSDSHVDYVDAALLAARAEAAGQPAQHAWRACDARLTPPRRGDLLCHTRAGTAAATTFAALAAALDRWRTEPPGTPYPMHCDLVVAADEGGDAKLEMIGGNVFQSVTLRRMTLNAAKTPSAAYLADVPQPPCRRSACDGNLNRQPWVVLLQFRN